MFGFACRETEPLMPAPIYLRARHPAPLAEAVIPARPPLLGPDAKSQVTLQYVKGKPIRATSVVVSTQHSEAIEQAEVREIVRRTCSTCCRTAGCADEPHFYVNPTGRFVIGGPDGDTGLTGRKIIVDTYGGSSPMGGGAFPARTRPRSTGRPPMPHAISRRTSWRRGSPSAARSRSPTRSAWPSRCRSISTPPAPARSTKTGSRRSCRSS